MKKRTLLTIIFLSLFLLLIGSCDDFSLIELINRDISLVPEEATLNIGKSITFNVVAGVNPYNFKVVGEGDINDNGKFTAPGLSEECRIIVTDSKNRTAEAAVTVVDLLTLSPQMVTTGIGGKVTFTINGGTAPYTVTLNDPSLGSQNHPGDSTPDFDFTAASTAGTETITVTDSQGQITETQVAIIASSELMIIPEVSEVIAGDVFSFSASGGTSPYVFSVIFNTGDDGTINPGNGKYTAPATPGTKTVRVTDNVGSTADATVYIVNKLLDIVPSSQTLHVGQEWTFTASNGTPPYTFSLAPEDNESASINSSSGLFTAIAFDPKVTVIVTDSRGAVDTCKVKILK